LSTTNKSDISYLHVKTSWAFEHSDQLKSSPGSHSRCSVCITSRFWYFCSQSASCHYVYVASASRYPELVTVLDCSQSYTKAAVQIAKVKSHGDNVRDEIIVHEISVDA